MALVLACQPGNDLARVLSMSGVPFERAEARDGALRLAGPGDGVLLLADGYPDRLTTLPEDFYAAADRIGVRTYVEFTGADTTEIRDTRWERGIVASDALAPDVEPHAILGIHGCRYVETTARDAHIVMARVAGLDTAVHGIPGDAAPILYEHVPGRHLVATMVLSRFVAGRYAPCETWASIWRWICRWLAPDTEIPSLGWQPLVRPTAARGEALASKAEAGAVQRGIDWYRNARVLVHPAWADEAGRRLHEYPDGTGPGPDSGWPAGDGSCGMIEGASSTIHTDGTQDWRYFLRDDCIGEAAFAHAVAGAITGSDEIASIARNLCDFIVGEPDISGGPRSDPASPHYGLLNWDTRADGGVYYGDDNARGLLGIVGAAAVLDCDAWDARVLAALLANLRTTGPGGFRPNRIDGGPLDQNGWRYYSGLDEVSLAPHYQAWLWACFLWAYRATGFAPFLERAKAGISTVMEAYPNDWRWTNGIQQERARMLLPLAWLVRVEDTDEHRHWLSFMAQELLSAQDECGAIREELGTVDSGAYGPPRKNEDYGTKEATLLQQNGDPICDLLYTTNFAFAGLQEAAAATGEAVYRDASDRLADFLVRIQIRSDEHIELDGGWFRAFDYRRWDYWGSNADLGWGVWSIESGWTQGWIVSVLAMRELRTSFWDLTQRSDIAAHLGELCALMMPPEGA